MEYVLIEYKAPTIDNTQMQLWFYSRPLQVIEENEESICVRYENESYWFDKKYIKTYSH